MLRELTFKPSYNKELDDIASDFYIPSMMHSQQYDRITGYFSSTIYIIAWRAIKSFVEKRGKIRIICSPFLTHEDETAIKHGYQARVDEIVRDSIVKEVKSVFDHDSLSAPHRLLAYLISEGIVDIKLAVVAESTSPAIRRMFHDKVGIFINNESDYVGFRGSMNETYYGLASDGNIESIDVFPSWVNERDKKRAEDAKDYFRQLWSNTSDGVYVLSFPEEAAKVLKERSKQVNWRELVDEVVQSESNQLKWSADKRRNAKRPREHQVDALEKWDANGRCGILEHATGSGKTYTAMCAIRSEIERGKSVLVLVPSIDLLNQWETELRSNIALPNLRILLCGGGNNNWRSDDTLTRWTQHNPSVNSIVLSTMDTASSEAFRNSLSMGNHLFLVADEVHRLGSEKRKNAFLIHCGTKLGLSATPKRYGDSEGTEAILSYFGGIIQPPYTLKDAINAGVLTRYFYSPHTVYLTGDERDAWNDLTDEIGRLIAMMDGLPFAEIIKTPSIKMKLLARARIIKNALNKVEIACKIIKDNYESGQKWIVYCDNQTQLENVLLTLLKEGFDAFEYHSEMSGDRKQTLEYFSLHGGVLVSIRCLDEGVDIPSTTHALILASSQNPREFIQRRGRILRKYPNKHYAHLFDVLVLPQKIISSLEKLKESSIIESEIARAIQFGEMAENPSCIAYLKNIAVDYNIEIDSVIEGGLEDGEE